MEGRAPAGLAGVMRVCDAEGLGRERQPSTGASCAGPTQQGGMLGPAPIMLPKPQLPLPSSIRSAWLPGHADISKGPRDDQPDRVIERLITLNERWSAPRPLNRTEVDPRIGKATLGDAVDDVNVTGRIQADAVFRSGLRATGLPNQQIVSLAAAEEAEVDRARIKGANSLPGSDHPQVPQNHAGAGNRDSQIGLTAAIDRRAFLADAPKLHALVNDHILAIATLGDPQHVPGARVVDGILDRVLAGLHLDRLRLGGGAPKQREKEKEPAE